MSYRYLPWTRRGLAGEVPGPDPLGATIPSRAELPVRVSLSTGAAADVGLRLYGPGDVVGIDPRAIVRLEPRRLSHDAEPDKLVAIEFDPPDFPWMFTPAAPGAGDRLRPWCVLVVVARQDGVRIQTLPGRPLPRLTIEAPAVPGRELPDLAESWAWAHTQVLEDGGGGALADHLAQRPNLNVSRLLCPRRLEPGRDWYACLVPAFEAGRLAGLGQPVPGTETTGPAWTSGSAAPAAAHLPVYFHWEFRTGPEGDFESLARRLRPRPVPEGVGERRMFVGAADPALPQMAPGDPGAVLKLEGALRAPQTGAGPQLDDVPSALRTELESVLEAPARHVVEGADPEAEAVAPPLYTQWHVRRHDVPDDRPRWFRELNLDPRARATAGLGADVVRANQEEYMDAAWRQVGEVLEANRLLDLARLARELATRLHARHLATLDAAALVRLTAPVHGRVRVEERTAQALLEASVLPPGATDPSFRRMAAPQSAPLKRAARLGGGELVAGAGVKVQVFDELATGEMRLTPTAGVPDGLLSSTLLDEASLGRFREETPVAPVEGLGAVPAGLLRRVREAATALEAQPAARLGVRRDIALSGMVTEAHVHRLESALKPGEALSEAIPLLTRREGPRELGRLVRDTGSIERFTVALQAQLGATREVTASIVPPPRALELTGLKATMVAATAPGPTVANRVASRISIGGTGLHEVADAVAARIGTDLDPVLAFPSLDRPTYLDLARHDQDRLLPGVGRIPADTVTLVETNPRFVEAFLAGMNHEMSRELLWREYPTDRRGSPFRRFWDRFDDAPDIPPVHRWDANRLLGNNSLGDVRGSLVLLVRGQLLRRYPNSILYAVPALPDGRLDENPARFAHPVFGGRLSPDVTFAGFDLTVEDVTPEPGWFFVIQEQPTEPRFGLDTPPSGDPGPLARWSDLNWGHAGVAPGAHLPVGRGPLHGRDLPLAAGAPVRATFGANSAHLAAITFQRPFRAAIHTRRVIAGTRR